MYLRSLDSNSSRSRFEDVLPVTVETANICGRSTHIETDDGKSARSGSMECSSIAYDASSRAGENCSGTAKIIHRSEATVALHKEDVNTF